MSGSFCQFPGFALFHTIFSCGYKGLCIGIFCDINMIKEKTNTRVMFSCKGPQPNMNCMCLVVCSVFMFPSHILHGCHPLFSIYTSDQIRPTVLPAVFTTSHHRNILTKKVLFKTRWNLFIHKKYPYPRNQCA